MGPGGIEGMCAGVGWIGVQCLLLCACILAFFLQSTPFTQSNELSCIQQCNAAFLFYNFRNQRGGEHF